MDDGELRASIDAYVDEVWPNVLDDLAELLTVPSVADAQAAEEGAPHGPEPKRALLMALDMCHDLGLDAHDVDGWIGYADLAGQSDKQIATIAHVDVVPAGTGWAFDPYALTQRDGYLIGRGVADDKGPAVLMMYAAHYFVRNGITPRYTIRVMLGSDEEVGMTDVEYYRERFDDPAFLFTPDANFPVCCGEKGLLEAAFISEQFKNGAIVSFDGGTVSNAVPGLATVVLRGTVSDLPPADDIDIEALEDGCVRLTAHGIGGHASLPEGTRNAIGMLVTYLLDHDLVSAQERTYLELLEKILASTDGSTIDIAATDDLFDPLTCIGGTIHMIDGRLEQSIDIRYPKSITGDELIERLTCLAEDYDATFAVACHMPPFYIDPANPAIAALVDAYNAFTGRDAKPFTIGGGTYARHFTQAVSFGPHDLLDDKDKPDWVGSMHGADEGVSEESMKRSLKIYIYALVKLMELDF